MVTGSWTGKGTDGAGKAIDAKERWADTWVKTGNGKWQCIASASAPVITPLKLSSKCLKAPASVPASTWPASSK